MSFAISGTEVFVHFDTCDKSVSEIAKNEFREQKVSESSLKPFVTFAQEDYFHDLSTYHAVSFSC